MNKNTPPRDREEEVISLRDIFTYYDEKDYLAHYGIKGQKWGVRRFQNSDGSLTQLGREHYGRSEGKLSRSEKKEIRKEYKQDNKQAYEYGRSATISGRAADVARKKEAKAQKKYDRRQSEKNADKLKVATKLRKDWEKTAKEAQNKAEQHRKDLVKKYGQEHVSSIKYDKKGRVNEKIHTGKEYWKSFLKTNLAGTAALLLGSPVSIMWYPSTKNQAAKQAYKASYDYETYNTEKWLPRKTAHSR